MSFEDYEDLLAEDTFDYVEDTFMDADDLAEHAVPSPPHIIDEDDFDIDLWQYDYWMDIDYASDGDEIRQRRHDSRKTKKRKLNASTSSIKKVSPNKKRKVMMPSSKVKRRPTGKAQAMEELPTVVMMKHAVDQRYEAQDIPTLDVKPLKSSALLGDWRERFANAPMFSSKKPTVELEEVEDIPDEDAEGDELEGMTEEQARALLVAQFGEEKANALLAGELGDLEVGLEEEEEKDGNADDDGWEDEDEEGTGDAEDKDEEGGPMDLDPEALKLAISSNLAAAGINTKGMDQNMIMQMAMQMMSGQGDSDAMIGKLTDSLLGGRKPKDDDDDEADDDESVATEDEAGFTGWVKKQAEEKAAAKEKKADLPTPADSEGRPSLSPPDKRKDSQKEEDATAGAEKEESRGTKRKAEMVVELDVSDLKQAKRPARRFDAPTASSKARSVSGSAPAPVAPAKRRGRKG